MTEAASSARCPADFQSERHRLYGFKGGALIHVRIPKRALQPRIKADEVATSPWTSSAIRSSSDLRGVRLFLRGGLPGQA
ncbi:hypothetical protein ACPA9J_10330 [Pseudomonas aeruginosa]